MTGLGNPNYGSTESDLHLMAPNASAPDGFQNQPLNVPLGKF